MLCTNKRVNNGLDRVQAAVRRSNHASRVRASKTRPPQVAEILGESRRPLLNDRGPFPRGHGHPSDILAEQEHAKRLRRRRPPPLPKARVEPLLFSGIFNNPKNNSWRKVESKTRSSGILLEKPLLHSNIRMIYEVSHHLFALRRLCQSVVGKHEHSDAVRLFHVTRRFFERSLEYTRGSVVDSSLRMCAIWLRVSRKQTTSDRSRL